MALQLTKQLKAKKLLVDAPGSHKKGFKKSLPRSAIVDVESKRHQSLGPLLMINHHVSILGGISGIRH